MKKLFTILLLLLSGIASSVLADHISDSSVTETATLCITDGDFIGNATGLFAFNAVDGSFCHISDAANRQTIIPRNSSSSTTLGFHGQKRPGFPTVRFCTTPSWKSHGNGQDDSMNLSSPVHNGVFSKERRIHFLRILVI